MPYKDPEQRRAYARAYRKTYDQTPEQQASRHDYYLRTREQFQERARQQYQRKKDEYARRAEERRAWLAATPIDPKALRDKYEAYRGLCAYCAAPLKPFSTQSGWDHVIPRSKGGLHSIDNIVPCCHPCNQRKAARLPEE